MHIPIGQAESGNCHDCISTITVDNNSHDVIFMQVKLHHIYVSVSICNVDFDCGILKLLLEASANMDKFLQKVSSSGPRKYYTMFIYLLIVFSFPPPVNLYSADREFYLSKIWYH